MKTTSNHPPGRTPDGTQDRDGAHRGPGGDRPGRLARWRRRGLVGTGAVAGAVAMVVLLGLAIPGCSVGYVTRQSATHLRVLAARQPVEKALRKNRIKPEWIPKIEVIRDARNFGVEALGLPADDLYESISLVRPDPMWVVTACPRDALQPVTWWFPVVGRVAYRGYYDRKDADAFAERLRKRDLDVLVQASDAFSSLGWFSDPIRPSMLDRRDPSLVNLVLHEAAHRVTYYKGQTGFNESFASFVGDEGTLLFYRGQDGAECERCTQISNRYHDASIFSGFIGEVVAELREMYAAVASRDEKLRRREEIFAAARARFAELPMRAGSYSWFADARLDNAVILSLQRYEGRRDVFERLLLACDGALERAVETVARLNWNKLPRREKKSTDPFDLLMQRLDDGDSCTER